MPESEFEEFEEETRPKREEEPKGTRYTVDCKFSEAKFNDAENAELAILTWDIKGDMPGSEFVSAKMTADSPMTRRAASSTSAGARSMSWR